MTDVSISVLRDPQTPNGGEAIIRIKGVALLPPGSTYRIEPLDDEGPAEVPEGWPTGELKPIAYRITPDGVDLLIGPDVAGAPALLPGTPVAISIDAVGARGELAWPSLPAVRGVRLAAVVKTGEQLAAELAEREQADRALAERAEAAARLAVKAALRAAEEARVAAEAAQRPTEIVAPAPVVPKPTVEAATPAPSVETFSRADNATPGATPRSTELSSLGSALGQAPVVAAPLPPPAAPKVDGIGPGKVPMPTPPPPAKPFPIERDGADPAPKPPRRVAALVGTFVLGLLTAGAAGLMVQNLMPGRGPPPAGAVKPVAVPLPEVYGIHPRLGEILRPANSSPLGRSAAGVGLEEALRLADEALHGSESVRNRAEARYWLRHALASGLGEDRLRWAMTQLGTLYAEPGNEPADYVAARSLWELAAAGGDPIALCFLASLSEHGLGTSRDVQRALVLYEQAKSRGGCRGLDEAINRLGRAAK